MKISGIKRQRMTDEINKISKERKEAIKLDQAVFLPFSINESTLVEEPDEETKKEFEKMFKQIEGYKDENFRQCLLVSTTAAMSLMASVFHNPMELMNPNFGKELEDVGFAAANHYFTRTHLYGKKDIDNDPYISKINLSNIETDNCHVEFIKKEEGNICLGSDFKENGYGYEHDICIAQEDVMIPIFFEGTKVTDRITMTEKMLMKDAVEKAHGRVIALDIGGFGYFSYLAHLKPEVESIQILMNDKAVAELFKEQILPQFDHPEKISVLCSEDNKFEEIIMEKEFDFCFCKLWNEQKTNLHIYLGLLQLVIRKPDIEFFIYMENALIEHAKNVMFSDLLVQTFSDIDFGIQVNDEGIGAVMAKFKDVQLLTPENIRNIFRKEKFKEILMTPVKINEGK